MKKYLMLFAFISIAVLTVISVGCPTGSSGPSIISITPASGATDVAIDTDITIAFSEEAFSSVKGSVTLTAPDDSTVDISFKHWGAGFESIVYMLNENLELNTEYSVAASGFQTPVGSTINGRNSTFTTAATDTFGPKIIDTTPSYKVVVIDLTCDTVSITFNEAIDVSGSETFTFAYSGGAGPTLDTPVWSNGNKTVTLDKTGNFLEEQVYVLSTTDVNDVSANTSADTVTFLTPYYMDYASGGYAGSNYPNNADEVTDDVVITKQLPYTININTNGYAWFNNLENATITVKLEGADRTFTTSLSGNGASLDITVTPETADMTTDRKDLVITFSNLYLQTLERNYILNDFIETFKFKKGRTIYLRIENAVRESDTDIAITNTTVYVTGNYGTNQWDPGNPSEEIEIGADQSGEVEMTDWVDGMTIQCKASIAMGTWQGDFNPNLVNGFGDTAVGNLEFVIPSDCNKVVVDSLADEVSFILY